VTAALTPILEGGVIAAGAGERLGGRLPKALRIVAGEPLLTHTLRRFERAGFERVAVIFREDDRGLVAWVKARFPDLPVEFVVKTTPSSAVSFLEIVRALGPGRSVLTTVDSILPPGAFEAFREAANALPEDALGLATTGWVDDEKPLWAVWDGHRRIRSLGGETGQGVTAGLYVVPHEMVELAEAHPPEAPLRRLLGAWVESGRPAYAVPVPKVVDVDRPEDVGTAEAYLRGEAPEEEGS